MSRRWTQKGSNEEIRAGRQVAGQSINGNRRHRQHIPTTGIGDLGFEGPPPILVHVLPPDQGGRGVAPTPDIVPNDIPGPGKRAGEGLAERIAPADDDVKPAQGTGGTAGTRVPGARGQEDHHRPGRPHGRMRRAPTQRGIQYAPSESLRSSREIFTPPLALWMNFPSPTYMPTCVTPAPGLAEKSRMSPG